MAGTVQRVAADGFREVQELFSDRALQRSPERRLSTTSGLGSHAGALARAVEVAVVPRLVLVGRAVEPGVPPPAPLIHPPPPRPAPMLAPGPTDAAELASLALSHDVSRASAFVAAVHARGSTMEALYLDLLAPTARHLGELWCDDRASFADVTIALGRLHQVMIGLAPAFCEDATSVRPARRRILLAPAPGEQHNFGLRMVADFFRRAGWAVDCLGIGATDDLMTMLRAERFSVVGFSMACGGRIEALAAAIRQVRRCSRNPGIGVMVGGPAFAEDPELSALVGADATATDARAAVMQAQHMLALLASGD